jgi:REP element-mobilizing transposase RayT
MRDKLLELNETFYELAAWVIMGNHVHIVILPRAPLSVIMKRLKGSTALSANQILGRSGAFWSIEYYNHAVRSEKEFNNIVGYVERNPVKAGLVESIEQWQWSSAYSQTD